jgi:tetratricopeptide (TPR) repeat protein
VAKVSLRIYNRDIENLIDQGLLDEAIAHCSHILKSFPKHLETYRLLGKGYLESKRYDEAVDIFQRVLVAVPDDFVSHVGMSIIRDDQGKLDDAIWHMERAFESQPSNAAIQGELRRLYGRRDGMEPPKIRMTRGALAHMYVQGELLPQAISEIKAVLGQDPQRTDMQVLLALAYFRSGQKADASEICNKLLGRPGGENCFEANRIMIELLQGGDSPEDVEDHRQRVNQLDPYAAFAQSSAFQSGAVSDGAVTLERLEYSGQSVEMDRDWSASGISLLSSQSQQQPEWLSSAAPGAEPAPGPVSTGGEDIPDFLRQAGWAESTGAAEEMPATFSIEETPPVAEGDLAPGDMPDWLKAMSPAEPEPVTQADVAGSESPGNTPDWLGGLAGGSVETPGSPAEAPITSEDTPPWLSGLGEIESSAQPAPAEAASMPDWLTPQETAPAESPHPAPSKPAATLETLGATAQEQDDAVAWLEGLAAKHGAKPEELVTDPNARSEIAPDWVEQARAIAESQPSAPAPITAKPEESLEIASEDETGIWLRGLAEKETLGDFAIGADKEETPVIPEADDKPSWLSGLTDQQTLADLPIESELEAAPVPSTEDEKPSWLKNLEVESDLQPITPEVEPESRAVESAISDLPAWLQGLDQESPQSETVEVPTLSAELESELPSWLQEEDVSEPALPTAPTDWQPVGPEAASGGSDLPGESEAEFEPQVEAVQPAPPPRKTPVPAKPAPEPAQASRAPARARQSEKAAPVADAALEMAQSELNRGDIPAALEHYGKLIKRGRFTEEIIRDLREALYRYPVEVTIWQALGDAYMRANRLQEALDAYTKAEELLR